MTRKKILFAMFTLVVVVWATALTTLPAFADSNKTQKQINNLNLNIIGQGQFVQLNKDGEIVLDGCDVLQINLNNSYGEVFTYSLTPYGGDEKTKIIDKAFAARGDEINLSEIYLQEPDGKYLLTIRAKKIGFNTEKESRIILNVETILPSIVYDGPSANINPERISLLSNKDTAYHWELMRVNHEKNVIIGVGEDALNNKLKDLEKGAYHLKMTVFLTTEFNNTFEFSTESVFEITN